MSETYYSIKKSTLTGIADAVRRKTGDTAQIAVSGLAEAISGIETGGGIDNTVLTASQVNAQAAAYLAATSGYTASNRSSVSVMGDYEDYTNTTYEDPMGATITLNETGTLYFLDETDGQNSWRETVSASGAYTCYNLIPNHTYRWWLKNSGGDTVQNGRIRLTGTLRMIYGSNQYLHNMRDNGGWSCDGGTIKYNLLIRGGTLAHQSGTPYVTAKDIMYLHDTLGVRLEVDMQYDTTYSASVLGADVERYVPYSVSVYYADMLKLTGTNYVATAKMLEKIMDYVSSGRAVYYHCWSGADRTGTTAVLLLGILGVAETDIDKDYELTCFYGGADHTDRKRTNTYYNAVFTYLYTFDGDSFRDKVLAWMVQAGVHLDKINRFRAAMSSGTPETLHWYLPVTKTLTGCTLSNSAAQIEYGDSYTATVTPESGKTMDSIVVTMGGADITSTAVSGGTISIPKVTGAVTITAAASVPSVVYSVVLNLTNAASSNAATSVAEGAAYTTTLSPTGTYKKLGAITVTMGGVDVSASAVSGSTVTIASVTGDITITCAATITNLIDTIGISANTRLSTASGDNRAQTGYAAIGANHDAASLIHLVAGDTLRIKGCSLPDADDYYSAIVLYSASGTFTSATKLHNGLAWNDMTFTNVGDSVVVAAGHNANYYFRISLICTDASAVIATINEPIE